MKNKIIIFLIATIATNTIQAQTGTNGNAVQVAQKIAKKMKDSLNLTGNQKNSIYDINMVLHNQKQAARLQYASTPAVLTTKMQTIEKTRDSLYTPILTAPQFILYKQKKRNLISNN
jgi:hypothetical protein